MTNEDKYLYSLQSFLLLARDVRQCQTLYRNLLVVSGRTNELADKESAEVAYARCRALERKFDDAIDLLLATAYERPTAPDPSPIALSTGIDWEIILFVGVLAVVVFLALWFWMDITVSWYFLAVMAGLALIAGIGYIVYMHRVSISKLKTEED